ncbi:MAG: excinuclease ABC subunit UvrA [Candidatus Tectomicrobia bacterium]|uniref:UvrABC system protein A n=1 Tax=Tectimicrobiota bacterium TaxID=2528274 RepID=A0A932MM90_UNCTE|nr:excinuclease ABC subunit UvrA [Candidatus Tectomicrobia bacterium]
MDEIVIEGAREHNLKNISLRLPRERFIVVTGPSGSGKSSLAFDTIYAEGHRRYVESLSTYARQFLERVDKPDVDFIDGISPAIAIEQYNPVKHSRSTVGTASEIYDYLRLLFAKAGQIHCPECGKPVRPATVDSTVSLLLEGFGGARGFVLFPLAPVPRDELEPRLGALQAQGFIRLMARGEVLDIAPPLPALAARLLGGGEAPAAIPRRGRGRPPKSAPAGALVRGVQVVADRLVFSEENRARLGESLETAFREGEGVAEVQVVDGPLLRFSQRLECCGRSFEPPTPLTFSFNNPQGACPECGGFGNTLNLDESLIIPNPKLTLAQGAVEPWTRPRYRRHFGKQLQEAAEREGLDIHRPWQDLPKKQKAMVLEGTEALLGVFPFFERLKRKKYKVWVRVFIRRYQTLQQCAVCGGARLRPEATWVKLGGETIAGLCAMPVERLRAYFQAPPLTPEQDGRARDILKQIRDRLEFLHEVGLDYLTLDRETRTLSGGEHQRINLANQLGAHLTGTLYILDEPTIGLHPRDNARLIHILKGLVERGNTLLVVEHDRDVIEQADHIVDLGPGAGERGGEIVFAGPRAELASCPASATAKYLTGARRVIPRRPRERAGANGRELTLLGASENNLKDVDLRVPLGKLVAVTGVSGSGKSTLVHDTLFPALARILHDAKDPIGRFREIHGFEQISAAVLLDQSPIGKSPRSNPITYLKGYDSVRRLFAETAAARGLGYGAGHFSFNAAGGRCESCAGSGFQKVEMHFMADLYIRCADCEGKRFKPQALEVRYKGLNIHEVLNLTVEEASLFFDDVLSIVSRLLVLRDVGLGYLRIGQPVNTLSGGEAQRLKIAGHLASKPPRDVLYLMDEPTTGLHFQDVERLLEVLLRLVALGNTVVVIEHNLDVIRAADWIVDLGPEGGGAGGRIVAEGPPAKVAQHPGSRTGVFLRAYFEKHPAA